MALQRYGGVGQGLMGATAPSVAQNPAPMTPGTANNALAPTGGTSDIDKRLDYKGTLRANQTGYAGRLAQKRRFNGETPLAGAGEGQQELTGGGDTATPYDGGPVHYMTGGASNNGQNSVNARTPNLNTALQSPTLQALTNQATQRFNPLGTPAAQAAASSNSAVPKSAGVPIYEKDRNEYNLHPGGPGYAGSLAERINSFNPTGNKDMPYAQGGTSGGWIDGIGETIGMGRSITPLLAKQQELQALKLGVPANFIQGFKQANPGDTNRLIEAYNSEQGGQGLGQPSWQNYALPTEAEVDQYFGGTNSSGSAGGGGTTPASGPSREEIEAEVRAKIEAENAAKAAADKKKADEDAAYRKSHPRGKLPGE